MYSHHYSAALETSEEREYIVTSSFLKQQCLKLSLCFASPHIPPIVSGPFFQIFYDLFNLGVLFSIKCIK